ncbi:hypothetical protein P4133_24920 [Pseudomonas aeruginosa]|nr:hypothetical protein [Pseudomonas aeruginosa]
MKVRGPAHRVGRGEAALCAQAGVESACAAVLGGGVASLGAVRYRAWRHGPKAPMELPAAQQPFAGLAEAEAVLTREIRALLEAPLELDDGLRRRWLDWLATRRQRAAAARRGVAPARLAGRGADRDGATLCAVCSPRTGAGLRCSSIPGWLLVWWLRACRTAARPRARLLEAAADAGCRRTPAVAVLDTRAGLWLDQGMASLLRPGLELDLFERSRVLLDAAARLPERIGCRRWTTACYLAEHLGRYDRVISFAALHAYAASREGPALAAALLHCRAACCWWTCYASRHWRCSVRPCSTTGRCAWRSCRACWPISPLRDWRRVASWRSERIALVEALAPGLGLDAAALQAGLGNACPRRCGPNACGACQACR